MWWNAGRPIAPTTMPRTTNPSDTRLVRRSQEGDRRAFRALLTRYDWRLRGLAYALLLDPTKVDAALRTAYVRAWREVVRIDARVDAATWLYRVAYNSCVDALRRESTRVGAAPPTMAPDTADPTPAGNGDRDRDGEAEATLTADVSSDDVVAALARLAPADRVAVVLVDREGFTPETAARILGLSPDVLDTRLAGARVTLAHQLGPTAPERTPPTEATPPTPPVASTPPAASADEAAGSDQLGAPVASGGAGTPSPNGTTGANGADDGGSAGS
jgi:RNA polymerase sigma-70 factor, ECF subfamily